MADAADVLGHPFARFPINCKDACDANDDGKIHLADAVYLLNFLCKFGASPVGPGSITDAQDPTDDSLDCESAGC